MTGWHARGDSAEHRGDHRVVSRECCDAGTEVDQNDTVQHHERFTGTLYLVVGVEAVHRGAMSLNWRGAHCSSSNWNGSGL